MFEIIKATEADCAEILGFIKGLAEYEKMSSDVVATEEMLRDWLFERRVAEVVFAVEDEKKVGLAPVFPQFLHIPRQSRYLS